LLPFPVDRDTLLLSPLIEHSEIAPFLGRGWELMGPTTVHEVSRHRLDVKRYHDDEDQNVEDQNTSAEEGGRRRKPKKFPRDCS